MTFTQKAALTEMLNAIVRVTHGPEDVKVRAGYLLWRLQGNALGSIFGSPFTGARTA